MEVILLVSRAGPNGAQNVGDKIDVSNQEAIRMIDAGQAVNVRSVEPEKSVRRPRAEKARK